jgi:DNA-binding FrmR family transcriptional regulator
MVYLSTVAHTIRHKTKLINRVRRVRGQIDAVERALNEEMECTDVLQRIAACRGAIESLFAEVLEDHIRFHIIERRDSADASDTGEELIDVVRTYLR